MKYTKTILFDLETRQVVAVADHTGDPLVEDPGDSRDWGEMMLASPDRYRMIGTGAAMDAQELRDRRNALGLTQETLAAILGRSKSILEKMESEGRNAVPIMGANAIQIDQVLVQLERGAAE